MAQDKDVFLFSAVGAMLKGCLVYRTNCIASFRNFWTASFWPCLKIKQMKYHFVIWKQLWSKCTVACMFFASKSTDHPSAELETIKTACKGYVWLHGCRPKSVCAGLCCGLDLTPAPSVTHSAVEAAYAACGSIYCKWWTFTFTFTWGGGDEIKRHRNKLIRNAVAVVQPPLVIQLAHCSCVNRTGRRHLHVAQKRTTQNTTDCNLSPDHVV